MKAVTPSPEEQIKITYKGKTVEASKDVFDVMLMCVSNDIDNWDEDADEEAGADVKEGVEDLRVKLAELID